MKKDIVSLPMDYWLELDEESTRLVRVFLRLLWLPFFFFVVLPWFVFIGFPFLLIKFLSGSDEL